MTEASANMAALKARIRAAGLKWTAARGAVLMTLTAAERPLSHAELVDLISEQGFDRATIYRNLMDLTGSGLVSRSDVGDHVWRFEIRDHADAVHPHFVCTSCGVVSCLPEAAVSMKSAALGEGVSRVDEVLLKGACQACA